MAETEKKGLTVKIDADLHAEVRKHLDAHEITMAKFVSMAFEDELHLKNTMKEGKLNEEAVSIIVGSGHGNVSGSLRRR